MEAQQTLAILGSIVTFAGILATLNERLNELFILPLAERFGVKDYNDHIALGVGTLLGILFGVDFLTPLADLFGITLNAPLAGLVVSGIVIGAGSNFLHKLAGSWGTGRTSIATTGPTEVTVNQPAGDAVTTPVESQPNGTTPEPVHVDPDYYRPVGG